MAKKTCGNCRHFAKEPDAGGRGCCFLSDDLGFYPVKGEHYAPCKGWKPQTNWQRCFGTPERAAETIEVITDTCYEYGMHYEASDCKKCPIYDHCAGKSTLLEWLESEEE